MCDVSCVLVGPFCFLQLNFLMSNSNNFFETFPQEMRSPLGSHWGLINDELQSDPVMNERFSMPKRYRLYCNASNKRYTWLNGWLGYSEGWGREINGAGVKLA